MRKLGSMNFVSKSMSRSTEVLTMIDDLGGSGREMNSTRHSWNAILDDKKPADNLRQSTSDSIEASDKSVNINRDSERNNRYRLSSAGCLSPPYLKDRPVTYEEELEEQVRRLRSGAIQLHQKLANERKSGKDLAQQMALQEETYKGLVEQMRLQYEQKFERLKGRAGLLIQRCEQLRKEKKDADEKLEQIKINSGNEKKNLQLHIKALIGEIEMLQSKEKVKEKDEGYVIENMQKSDEVKENNSDVELVSNKNQTSPNKTSDIWWNYYKILYNIALTKVVFFENLPKQESQDLAQYSLIGDDCIEVPVSISRRSSSCPILAAAGDNDGLTRELHSDISCMDGIQPSLSEENLSSASQRFDDDLDSPKTPRKKLGKNILIKSPQKMTDERKKISTLFINIVSPGGTQTPEETEESSSSPKHIQDRSKYAAKRHASLPRMEFLKKLTVRDKKEKEVPKRKNKTSGPRTTQSMYGSVPCEQEYFNSIGLRNEKHSSAESLNEETMENRSPITLLHERLIRNGSAQSTFDRLRQRRNGLTDIKISPRVPNKAVSSSVLDRIGSNLKQYLHHQ